MSVDQALEESTSVTSPTQDPFWQLVGAGSLAVVLIVWTWSGALVSSESRVLLAAVVAAAGLSTTIHVYRSRRGERLVPLVVAGMVLGAYAAAVVFSPAWRTSLESAYVPVGSLVLFLFAAYGPISARLLHRAGAGAGITVALFVLWAFAQSVVEWWSTVAAVVPSSSFLQRLPISLPRTGFGPTHPNLVAMVLAATIPVAASQLRPSRGSRRWLVVASIVVMGAALLVTGSRGGLLAAGLGAVLALAITRSDRTLLSGRGMRIGVAALVGLILLGVVLIASGVRPTFIFRGTFGDRIPVMEAGWRMFLDRPLLGHGPGAFGWLADSYLGARYPGSTARLVWIHAHNGYANLLAEIGVVGALATATAFGLVVVSFLRGRVPGERGLAPASAASLGVMAALAMHAVVDVATLRMGVLTYAAVVVGAALRDRSSQTVGFRWVAGGAALVSLAVILPVAWSLPANLDYERGREAAMTGEWTTAEEMFEKAAGRDPMPLYPRMEAVAALESRRASTGVEELTEAAAHLRPPDVPAYLNELRVTGLDRPLPPPLADLHDEVALADLASMYLRSGRLIAAEIRLRRMLEINPWLVSAPIWGELQRGTEIRERLVEDLLQDEPCVVGEAFLLEGFTASDRVLNDCPVLSRAGLAAVAMGGRPESAIRLLDDRLQQTVDDPVLRRWRGIASTRAGDVEKGRYDLTVAALLGDAPALRELISGLERDSLPRELVRRMATVPFDSPVVPQSSTTWYSLAAVRTEQNSHREPVPSPLPHGAWEGTIPGVHVDLLEMLRGPAEE